MKNGGNTRINKRESSISCVKKKKYLKITQDIDFLFLFDIIIVVEKRRQLGADDWLKMVNFKMAIEALFQRILFYSNTK